MGSTLPAQESENTAPKDEAQATTQSVGLKNWAILILISVFPVALTSFIWIQLWRGVASRAIDGSGHYAIGQIYDQQIFPEAFGWVPAYFSGMSFPNFYPPLFFWCVSLIHHTNLVSYATAFKLVVCVPMLLLPAAFWVVAWVHSGKNVGIAFGAAVAAMTMYTLGEAFRHSTGLDISSTLIDGFYTQPLGFLLLLAWIVVYLLPRQNIWQFTCATLLLALTILANFFNAMTAIVFIASVLVWDLVTFLRASDKVRRSDATQTFLLHFASPWLALALSAFWVVPMLTCYKFLVTLPLIKPLRALTTTPVWCWYFLAALGAYLWLRNRSGRLGSYLTACLVFFLALTFASGFAPTWFPLQVFRFFSTINFLLSVPVGISLAYGAKFYFQEGKNKQTKTTNQKTRTRVLMPALIVVGLVVIGFVMSTKQLGPASGFYTRESYQRITPVLEFAKTHDDGSYLVEVRENVGEPPLRADCLALNAYLGVQGNRVISIVYREASPNSGFFNAEVNAFSKYRENFGISSALLDDLDFLDQPLSIHLKRLQFVGVRYLVIGTPEMKERLANEPEIGERFELGDWTIFALRQPAAATVRTLQYRPALLVSDFTVKLRRQNQLDFMRLAEEQFSDAWFDVLLVRSEESKLDRLVNLKNFGALIIDKYEYQNGDQAYNLIKDFAQDHPVVLISSSSSLFSRIQSSLASFPRATVIERPFDPPGSWIVEEEPSHHYKGSAIQKLWQSIKAVLEKQKIPIGSANIQAVIDRTKVLLRSDQRNTHVGIPVLLSQTYHPKWRRSDGQPIYATTPFYTLTFVDEPTELTFKRDGYDRMAIWLSLVTSLVMLVVVAIPVVQRRRSSSNKSQTVSPT